jgi:DNA-binding SARP family transcriptional activator
MEDKALGQAGPVHPVSRVMLHPPLFTRQSPVDPVPVAMPDLNVYCLGNFRVYYHDQLIQDWSGNKSRSLFKFLLVNRDKAVHVDQLLDLFWRDAPPEAARRSLYQAIYLVRQSIRPNESARPSIIQVNGGYRLNPDLSVWVDSEAFLRRYQRGLEFARKGDEHQAARELLAAEILYEGDYLVEDLYEDWPVAAREQLRNAYLDALDRLSLYYQATDRNALCIAYCRKLLEIDGTREDVHRRLMRAFMREGQRSLALRQYHRCVESLRDELDVDPLPATVELYKKLLNSEDHFLQADDLNRD